MNQPINQHARDQAARQRAAAILAQSRQGPMERPQPEEPEMKRYIHPVPCWGNCPGPAPAPGGGPYMDRVLEELARQNQLLVELLGAVNALTAATLSIRSRFVGQESRG